jgi:hypothetical protein
MSKVFVSHSSKDKPFARRLGNDLKQYGADVWIDECEINIGDSLIEKISQGIMESNYLIVILSSNSVNAAWVKKEVEIALYREINGKNICVLPCLLDNSELPIFLQGKLYADFRDKSKYVGSRTKLIKAIGLTEKSPDKLFLDQHVFYDLVDLNDGFDVESIRYFTQQDFIKVLKRAEYFNLDIYGIEPWPNGQFGGVKIYEEYNLESNNSQWYFKAFSEFLDEGIDNYFSASYGISKKLLEIFQNLAISE